jgi:hypothetical protein
MRATASAALVALLLAAPVAMLLALLAAPLHGQQGPMLAGGLEVRAGGTLTDSELVVPALSVDVDLGWVGARWLRPIVGLDWSRVEPDAGAAGSRVVAWGGRACVRLDPIGAQRISPYAGAAVLLQRVSATGEVAVGDGITGTRLGMAVGGGVMLAVDAPQHWSLLAEARRSFLSDLEHWTLQLGVRYSALGRMAYAPFGR